MAFVKGKLTVKATSSDRTVGGRDLDNVLYEHFRKEFLEKNKVDLNERPRSRIRLLTECEKLKKLMSANNSSLPINIECLTDEHDFRSHLSRLVLGGWRLGRLSLGAASRYRCLKMSMSTTVRDTRLQSNRNVVSYISVYAWALYSRLNIYRWLV